MAGYCLSCGAPLNKEFKGVSEEYCKYCTDENGNLFPRERVKQGIMMWLKEWQPKVDDKKAAMRAEYYMKAMPAWAED